MKIFDKLNHFFLKNKKTLRNVGFFLMAFFSFLSIIILISLCAREYDKLGSIIERRLPQKAHETGFSYLVFELPNCRECARHRVFVERVVEKKLKTKDSIFYFDMSKSSGRSAEINLKKEIPGFTVHTIPTIVYGTSTVYGFKSARESGREILMMLEISNKKVKTDTDNTYENLPIFLWFFYRFYEVATEILGLDNFLHIRK